MKMSGRVSAALIEDGIVGEQWVAGVRSGGEDRARGWVLGGTICGSEKK
jgi:hypothetical protein